MTKLGSFLIFILLFFNSCNPQVKVISPPGYDLTEPQILKMPAGLNEISGIAFNAANSDTIYAEQDEEGRLFYFSSASLDVKHKKFGRKGDYEDIAISKGIAVILRSDGVLFTFPLNANGDDEIKEVLETPGLLPPGEYEGIYADEAANLLYVLCKNCNADKSSKNVTGYILQMTPGKGIELKTNFQVNMHDIAKKSGEKKILFRPSALARNTGSQEWYIISSVNKLLVITDNKWAIKDVYSLDPSLFNQPEGIAFDKANNLYISNERAGSANATVLKFILKKINE